MARWPWSRRVKDTSQLPGKVPKEVEEYYESAKRERVGVAWLLALGTLIVTVVLAAALFFGGRWVYRTVFTNNDESADQTAQGGSGSAEQSPSSDNHPESRESQNSQSDQSQNDEGNTEHSDETENSDSSDAGSSDVTKRNDHETNVGEGTHTPGTGPTAAEIPNTGPANTTVLVATVTLVGAAGHNIATRLKSRDN